MAERAPRPKLKRLRAEPEGKPEAAEAPPAKRKARSPGTAKSPTAPPPPSKGKAPSKKAATGGKKGAQSDRPKKSKQVITSTFVSDGLRKRLDRIERREFSRTPLHEHGTDRLAWLVANPQYIATRVLQQALPGLVTTAFGYTRGLLLFHNEYTLQRALGQKKVTVGGRVYRIHQYDRKPRDLACLLERNEKNQQYPKAILEAQMTELAARALLEKLPSLEKVQWVGEGRRESGPRGWPVICGATGVFGEEAACRQAVGVGLFNIEGEHVRVRPYKAWDERYETVPQPAVPSKTRRASATKA